jgi:hypothetical protein
MAKLQHLASLFMVPLSRSSKSDRPCTTNGNSSSLTPHKRQRSSSSINTSEPSIQHTSFPQAPSSSTSLSDANSRPNEVKNGDEQCISKTVSKVAVTNKLSLEGAAHQYRTSRTVLLLARTSSRRLSLMCQPSKHSLKKSVTMAAVVYRIVSRGFCSPIASFTSFRDVKQEEHYCELVTDFINLIWHLKGCWSPSGRTKY